MPGAGVEAEEGGEEGEEAAEDEEERHEEEVDGDDLEQVDAVEAHEAGADAHQEEARGQQDEVDGQVQVAAPVRAREHVGVLHDRGLKRTREVEKISLLGLDLGFCLFYCLRAVGCLGGPSRSYPRRQGRTLGRAGGDIFTFRLLTSQRFIRRNSNKCYYFSNIIR